MYSNYDDKTETPDSGVIHSGFTYFPTLRHILTVVFLLILEIEGIYLCVPLNINANISFLIGQIILLAVIIYSWLQILGTVPGPMSEFFNQELLTKAIQQGLNPNKNNQKDENTICTNCQVENVAKTYHCDQCNRCVYKNYFHSRWLNTCIAKQNFPPFISFLIFLDSYLILLGVDNLIFFYNIWDQNQQNFTEFFFQYPSNVIVTLFLFIILFLTIAVTCTIVTTYYFAFRTRQLVAPTTCFSQCKGSKAKFNDHDKILQKIRQSIRGSTFIQLKRNQPSKCSDGLFRQTQTVNPLDLIFQALNANVDQGQQKNGKKKNKKNNQNSDGPSADAKKQLFTNLFAALLKPQNKQAQQNKNQNQNDRPQGFRDLFGIENNEHIEHISRDASKKQTKLTVEKTSNDSQLAEAVSQTKQESKNSSLQNTLDQVDRGSCTRRQLMKKKSNFARRKLRPIDTFKNDDEKQNQVIIPRKNIKFTKLVQNPQKMDDISEKISLESDNQSKKSRKQKKQNDQESIQQLY